MPGGIRQRALVSTLTVCRWVWAWRWSWRCWSSGVVYQSFHRGGSYDLIVGGKGGKATGAQHGLLPQPARGNIPQLLRRATEGSQYAASVATAIPVCMGHTYQSFRVVGTGPEMFTELKYRGDRSYEFTACETFKTEDHFAAVVGAIAAAKAGLQVGEKFQAVHGTSEGGRTHKETFHVVGVLAPTSTPVDRAIFVNMEGFYDIHGAEDVTTRET